MPHECARRAWGQKSKAIGRSPTPRVEFAFFFCTWQAGWNVPTRALPWWALALSESVSYAMGEGVFRGAGTLRRLERNARICVFAVLLHLRWVADFSLLGWAMRCLR
jgi:hypothetical protein